MQSLVWAFEIYAYENMLHVIDIAIIAVFDVQYSLPLVTLTFKL